MKILATSAPSEEHLYPMLPTLWALRNAGHDVLVALPAQLAKITAATGLPATRVSDDITICFGSRSGQDATVGDLVGHIVGHYVPVTEQTVDRTVAIAEVWQPDLVVCSDFEYSGPIAAAAIGVPTVLHGRGMLPHPAIAAPVAEALLPLHRKWGLHDGAPDHWKIIDNCPPSLQWTTPPTNAIAGRYVTFHSPGELPSWIFDEPEAPRVLVTMSNEPLVEDRAKLLRRIMQALLPLDIEAIVATGDKLELDRLTELPRRTRITHGLPLSHLVPTCSVVINDGAASSVMAAAIDGVPQLGLPQVSGQYQHADRIAEIGAGIAIDPEQATVPAISDATSTLLSELGQRAIARRLQVENGGQPRLDEVVQVLERAMASQGRPAYSPGRGRHRNPRLALDVPTMRVPQAKRGQQPSAEQSAPGRHSIGGNVFTTNRQQGA
ncbi:nucleotide disphospho-sugar-binding domain-containing protein [Actinocrispum sp. NPDC049592]|uniref:nucleotide disphospho-sugar-binding domain-containing protein n=1 Tax=Actinocrispum sp. NPDC049592 TaxID=3154835 RepID=UPI00342F8287